MFFLKFIVIGVVTFFITIFYYGFLSADPSRNPNRKLVDIDED